MGVYFYIYIFSDIILNFDKFVIGMMFSWVVHLLWKIKNVLWKMLLTVQTLHSTL